MMVRSHSVATSAGAVKVVTGGNGPPVVLLHGTGHSHQEFARCLPSLAKDFTVVAWDMPGHGASAHVDATLSIDERAEVLAEILGTINLSQALIVGASIGAFIAVALTKNHSQQVRGLLLSEMQLRTREWWISAKPQIEAMFSTAAQSRETVEARLQTPLGDDLLEQWNADRIAAGPVSMMAAMDAIRDYDLTLSLSQISVPTRALFGNYGPALASSDALSSIMPSARIEIVEYAGHFISIDCPDAFVEAIRSLHQETDKS